jgi:hypothetical protein
MHSKDSEPLDFFGLTGHIDLMNSTYQEVSRLSND